MQSLRSTLPKKRNPSQGLRFRNNKLSVQEKSCGGLIFYQNEPGEREYLLIQHKRGDHWSFPKGHVEKSETEEMTALREIEEETGLKVEIIPPFREQISYKTQQAKLKEVIFFLAETKEKEIKMSKDEIKASSWLPYEKALKKITYENTKDILEKAEEFLIKRKRGYED